MDTKKFNKQKIKRGINSMKNKFNVKPSYMLANVAIASVAFASTFVVTGNNTSTVKANSLNMPNVSVYNKQAVNVNYGDDSAMINVAKDILGDKVSKIENPKAVKTIDGSKEYQLGNYIIKIGSIKNKKDEMICPISIEKQKTAKKMLMGNDNKTKINDSTAYVYNVKVNLVDSSAPVLTLNTDSVDIKETEGFNAVKYIESAIDNHDSDLSIKADTSALKINDEGNYERGSYVVKYSVADKAGNTTTKDLKVNVVEDKELTKQKEEAKQQEQEAANANNQAANTNNINNTNNVVNTMNNNNTIAGTVQTTNVKAVPSSSKGAAIASAAMAQLGVHQDCTMLVTNSLKAVGINFHGWPQDYLSLGSITSNPQPGDICVYGNAHVAIYIGGGKAVHGGWAGGTTAIFSTHCSAGDPVYVRVR